MLPGQRPRRSFFVYTQARCKEVLPEPQPGSSLSDSPEGGRSDSVRVAPRQWVSRVWETRHMQGYLWDRNIRFNKHGRGAWGPCPQETQLSDKCDKTRRRAGMITLGEVTVVGAEGLRFRVQKRWCEPESQEDVTPKQPLVPGKSRGPERLYAVSGVPRPVQPHQSQTPSLGL